MKKSIKQIIVAIVFLVSYSFSMLMTALASEKISDEALNTYTDATGFGRENMLFCGLFSV